MKFYETHPELVNADKINEKCPNDNETVIEYGCYIPKDNKIYILEVTDPEYKDVEYTTAAHETLHSAYVNLAAEERTSIDNQLQELYNNSKYADVVKLHDTIKSYGTESIVVNNELHSFIGSEIPEYHLTSALNNYYSKYFSDSSVSVKANVRFNNTIDYKTSSLSTGYSYLDSLKASIDDYKSQHLDNIESAMNRDDYYGNTYSYNKNVEAYNHNLVYYNQQIDSYNSQRLTYNAEVDKFNAVLKAFYPSKTLLNTKQ